MTDKTTRDKLKGYFKTGNIPTEENFSELIDAVLIKDQDGNVSFGKGAVTMGSGTEATGDYAVAMGLDTKATGADAVAMGCSTEATGVDAVAMGYYTEASGDCAVTMGHWTKATKKRTVAMGEYTVASDENCLAIGKFNETAPDNQNRERRLFVVGNGTDDGARRNALTLNESGDLRISGSGAAYQFINESDSRVKLNPQKINPKEALACINKMNLVDYEHIPEYRENEKGRGVIAQELKEILPEAVSVGPDRVLSDKRVIKDFLSVDYNQVFITGMAAIQELQRENQRLSAEIKELKKAIRSVKQNQEKTMNRPERRIDLSIIAQEIGTVLNATESEPPDQPAFQVGEDKAST